MSEIPKVSVIIPIYRVEPYIERCVRSLMEQTMRECIEFIFINDATPDGSMRLLKQVLGDYPARESQIRIINHNENKGIAYTRGEGIKEAKGEYIGWCDSDDWCEPTMFENLYAAAQNGSVDMVVCDIYRHDESNVSIVSNLECNTPEGYLTMILSFVRWQFFSVLYSKLIRRSVFIDNNIFPYDGINRSEDLNVMIRVCCKARTIVFVKEALYHYNKINTDSITHIKYETSNDWNQQKRNVEIISTYIKKEKPKKWKIIRAYLQFYTKAECAGAFDSVKSFYKDYRNSHWYILSFSSIPIMIRIKMFVVYNIYPIFKLRVQNEHIKSRS